MNNLKFAFVFIFTFSLLASSIAQDWISYQSQLGINDLVETNNELLMATSAGLVVMDKTTLAKTIYNKGNTSLSNNHIQTITQAPNGNTWIGTYDVSLAQFDGNDFQEVPVPAGKAYTPGSTELYDFEIAPNGDFWLGTEDGVIHKAGNTWTHYDELELGATFFKAWDIVISPSGEVFLATNEVLQFNNGTWTDIMGSSTLQAYLDADLFFDSSGDLFLAGDLDNIGRYDGNQWESLSHPLNGSQIRGFAEDSNGDIYFQSQYDGIFKLENNTWIQQSDAQTQAVNNQVSYFHIDEQGRRWLNSNIHLSVNDNGTIQSTLISQHTLESNGIINLKKGMDGSMVFVSYSDNNMAAVDPQGNWSFIPLPNSLGIGEFLLDLSFFSANDIWLGTAFGLYHYDGNQWDFNALGFCRGIAVDSQGKIYVRSDGKIYIIEGGNISEINPSNSPLLNKPIIGHGIDANDNLWLAPYEENLIQKVSPNGTWTNFSQMDHPAIEDIEGDFHFDVNGNMWVPRSGVGVIRYDGTSFTNPYDGNITQMDNYNVFSVESDLNGKMYFSHQYGVTTWEDGVWADLLIEDVPQVNSSHHAHHRFDNQGNLWWASTRYGVFAYPTGITNTQALVLEEKIDFNLYPNPASSFTTLDFVLEEAAEVTILLYNQIGQTIANLSLGKVPVGNHQETIDFNHLPRGIYNIQLQINQQSSTRRIIIQ